MKIQLKYLAIFLLGLTLIQGCEDSDDEDFDGITTLQIGELVSGTLSDDEAEFTFSVNEGIEYQVVLTPESSSDDPDLLVFSSEQQLGDYWDIVDASGGESSTQAIAARVAKSDFSPGTIDKATFIANTNGMYFAAVTGPENSRFSILVNSSDSICANECVDNTEVSEDVENTSPAHNTLVSTIPVQLEITFSDNFTMPSLFNMEIFELPSGSDSCQINRPGLRCGWLDGNESFELVTRDSAITAIATVNGRTVTFTPDSSLLAGHTYVVHIFADASSGDYKTWWRFET